MALTPLRYSIAGTSAASPAKSGLTGHDQTYHYGQAAGNNDDHPSGGDGSGVISVHDPLNYRAKDDLPDEHLPT